MPVMSTKLWSSTRFRGIYQLCLQIPHFKYLRLQTTKFKHYKTVSFFICQEHCKTYLFVVTDLKVLTFFSEVANLNRLQKLDISYQCSIRKYSHRTRRRTVLERGYVNKTDNNCTDKRLENLFSVVPSCLKTLIATAVTSLKSCIPRLSISIKVSWNT